MTNEDYRKLYEKYVLPLGSEAQAHPLIKAERERCRRIANEALHKLPVTNTEEKYWNYACDYIEKKITGEYK